MTDEDLIDLIENTPDDTHEEYLNKLEKYKAIIGQLPNELLKFHLEDSIEKEHYKLAEYIKDLAKTRGLNLIGA